MTVTTIGTKLGARRAWPRPAVVARRGAYVLGVVALASIPVAAKAGFHAVMATPATPAIGWAHPGASALAPTLATPCTGAPRLVSGTLPSGTHLGAGCHLLGQPHARRATEAVLATGAGSVTVRYLPGAGGLLEATGAGTSLAFDYSTAH